MGENEFLAANPRNWDERVPIHRRDRSGFYAVERFLAGDKHLHAIELGELGDVAGERVVHLQCHFGLDTLILARHGARVTGVDFSSAAIAEAKRLAQQTGLAAEFVCADIYDARRAVTGDFDIAYTTWGTICWLPDLNRWAQVIAALLAGRVPVFRRRAPEHADPGRAQRPPRARLRDRHAAGPAARRRRDAQLQR
jgi:SAM-dependent methyltransferase